MTPWHLSHKGDLAALAIADRHYNRQKPGSLQFVPPGRSVVLLAEHALWVTSWPFAQYVKHAWGGAWVCSIFRNEGHGLLSSELITLAVAHTRYVRPDVPDLGIVTFVDPGKVRPKRDPGRCFLRAGWHVVGRTKDRNLVALQQLPADMPEALPIGQAQLFEAYGARRG